jgi:hypothetical protein
MWVMVCCRESRLHVSTAITTLAITSSQKTAVVHAGWKRKVSVSEKGFVLNVS